MMRRCPHDRRVARAFTLPEALAVVVLCAIVLPVAMRAIALTVNLASLSSQRVRATQLAESKLNELIATTAWQDSTLEGDFATLPSGATLVKTADANASGEASGDAEGFAWSAQLSDWTDATLQSLSVTVTWTQRGQEHSVTLTTLVSEDL